MKITSKMAETAIILITVLAMLGPVFGLDTIASASAQTVSTETAPAQTVVDPAAEIEKAFASGNPGEEIGKAIGDAMSNAGVALMVPIMGIIGVFFVPAAVVILSIWFVFHYLNKKQQMKHETIRQMVEKGVPIPENFPWDDTQPRQPASTLGRGLKLVGIGLGLIVFFIVFGWTNFAGIGAIPLFIGLAYLLVWHLEKKKTGASA
jgi:hypothetical protein